MRINSIHTSYYNKQNNKKRISTQPQFKGALNEVQYYYVLNRLKAVNKTTTMGFSKEKLTGIIEKLGNKYQNINNHSIGIQIISNIDLPLFLGNVANKYDLRDKIGICIAVGDTKAPLERMNNIFEAETIIAKESDLSSIQ